MVAPRLVPVLLFVILLYIYNYIFKCILYCGDNYILYNICILIHSILSYIYSISSFLRSFCWDKFCANIQSFTLGPCLDKNCLCSSCTALGDENPNHSTQTLKKSVMVALWSDMIKYDQIWSVSSVTFQVHASLPVSHLHKRGSRFCHLSDVRDPKTLTQRPQGSQGSQGGQLEICCADQMELGGNCRRVTSVSAWEATQKGRSWKKCNDSVMKCNKL